MDLTNNDPVLEKILDKHDVQFPLNDIQLYDFIHGRRADKTLNISQECAEQILSYLVYDKIPDYAA